MNGISNLKLIHVNPYQYTFDISGNFPAISHHKFSINSVKSEQLLKILNSNIRRIIIVQIKKGKQMFI